MHCKYCISRVVLSRQISTQLPDKGKVPESKSRAQKVENVPPLLESLIPRPALAASSIVSGITAVSTYLQSEDSILNTTEAEEGEEEGYQTEYQKKHQ